MNNVTIQPPGGFGGASVLYTFDNTSNDYYGNYNANPFNNPGFVSPGYNGRGSAVQFFSNRSQCFSVPNHMDFHNKSLTMEAWVYPSISTIAGSDVIIYVQMNAQLYGQAVYTTLRSGRFLGSFYFIDTYTLTVFQPNQWQHLAFTYNFSTRTQTVYFNGVLGKENINIENSSFRLTLFFLLDAINTNANPCQVTHGTQHIGCISGTIYCFDGYMDQLAFLFNRSKTADEILGDATLVAYYTMDCTNVDSGPNHMNSTAVDLSQGDGGRVKESFLFNLHSSYFQVTQLLLLGEWYRPFSFAMWLRPVTLVTLGGTILHLSRDIDGTNSCAQLIGLNSFGQIVVHGLNTSGLVELVGPVLKTAEWIHIVETYSQTNGLRLYVNGTLYGQSSPFSYAASGVPMTVTLGQALSGGENCLHGTIRTGYYRGQIDEFYIYSRELSQAHVTALSNP